MTLLKLTIPRKPALVQETVSCQRLLEIDALADVNEAIRQGLDDVESGRTRPAQEVFDEIRRRYDIPRGD